MDYQYLSEKIMEKRAGKAFAAATRATKAMRRAKRVAQNLYKHRDHGKFLMKKDPTGGLFKKHQVKLNAKAGVKERYAQKLNRKVQLKDMKKGRTGGEWNDMPEGAYTAAEKGHTQQLHQRRFYREVATSPRGTSTHSPYAKNLNVSIQQNPDGSSIKSQGRLLADKLKLRTDMYGRDLPGSRRHKWVESIG